MNDERKELIGEINKNSLETVKVHVSEYKGKVYVDARIFVQDDASKPGVVIATKKGLCLSPDLMLELIPLLSKAQERAARDFLKTHPEEVKKAWGSTRPVEGVPPAVITKAGGSDAD